jgi:peptidoglycan/LPS O-acetylase OafA/YrhL
MAPERDAYRFFDAFRFLAALVVLFGHARAALWVDPDQAVVLSWWAKSVYFVAGLGHAAVMVFFVLSGFWITQSVERLAPHERFWAEYLTDRWSRLLIVILPALLVGGALDLAGAGLFDGPIYFDGLGAHNVFKNVYDCLTPAVFLGNLLFLQGFTNVAPFGSNTPLWSLAFEFWYYVWFAALALAARRRFSPVLLSLALALLSPRLATGFLVWMVGSMLFYADRRYDEHSRSRPFRTLGFVICGGLALLAALVAARMHWLPEPISDLVVGVSFAGFGWGLLGGAVRFPNRLLPLLSRYGAKSSFSLYVIHYPLINFTVSAYGLRQRYQPAVGSLVGIVLLCALAIFGGWAFSRLTEAHTGRLRNWLKGRGRSANRLE